jgi:hypothetical protein
MKHNWPDKWEAILVSISQHVTATSFSNNLKMLLPLEYVTEKHRLNVELDLQS